MREGFEDMLTGGHPNSLGRTVDVVEAVLADPPRIEELFGCYQSKDEVVRLRVSNALRRVQAERPDLIVPLIDRLIGEIGNLDQPSAQWTLPKLFEGAAGDMTAEQSDAALAIVKRNLVHHDDWIVLNNSIEYLATKARADAGFKTWLLPHLSRLAQDRRKSVAKRAAKHLAALTGV